MKWLYLIVASLLVVSGLPLILDLFLAFGVAVYFIADAHNKQSRRALRS